ncbi:MAG: hypothetical protein EOO77_29125 [Oxalobacteraceae bacterium]|nr:MAG: hypothetical protein EOO77_29125 [Oxalobacteraceae bacterium]
MTEMPACERQLSIRMTAAIWTRQAYFLVRITERGSGATLRFGRSRFSERNWTNDYWCSCTEINGEFDQRDMRLSARWFSEF